jgi:hypothetical protein
MLATIVLGQRLRCFCPRCRCFAVAQRIVRTAFKPLDDRRFCMVATRRGKGQRGESRGQHQSTEKSTFAGTGPSDCQGLLCAFPTIDCLWPGV